MQTHRPENKMLRTNLNPKTLMAEVREREGLSRSELAYKARVSYDLISDAELRGVALRDYEQRAIAKALGRDGLFDETGRAVTMGGCK